MTESSPRTRSGRQLAEDLRAIREERGVELKDIIDATRLAEDVIEQFERTALLDNPVFNRVYLRSLVSSYARLIDIDENVALQAVDDMLRGEYEGALGKIYLGEEPRPAGEAAGDSGGAPNDEAASEHDDEPQDRIPPDDAAPEYGTAVSEPPELPPAGSEEVKDAPSDPDPDFEPESSADPAGTGPPGVSDADTSGDNEPDADTPAAETPPSGETPAPETPPSGETPAADPPGEAEPDEKPPKDEGKARAESSTDAGAGAIPSGKRAAGAGVPATGSRKSRPGGAHASSDSGTSVIGPSESRKGLLLPDMRGLLAAIVAGVVLIALVWISVAWFLDNAEEPEPESTVPAVDSSYVEPEPEPGPDPVSLPDTFEVRVIALDEPLDPIRGRVDDDLRRPYWVELGDTLTFRVADTVILEREVDHALVVVENWLPPPGWLDADGTYVITRERTQAWLDSLIAAGIFPPEAPDSLEIPGLEELRSGDPDPES